MENPERIAMMKNLGWPQMGQLSRVTSLTIARSCFHRIAEQRDRVQRSQKYLDLVEYECVVMKYDQSKEAHHKRYQTLGRPFPSLFKHPI